MNLPNSNSWSPCSVTAIEKFVRTASCLFNKPAVDTYPLFDWQDLSDGIQGGAPRLSDQCSPYQWPGVSCGDNPCQYLECQVQDHSTVSHKNKTICTPQERNYAMEGTICGKGKFCFQGKCRKGNNYFLTILIGLPMISMIVVAILPMISMSVVAIIFPYRRATQSLELIHLTKYCLGP